MSVWRSGSAMCTQPAVVRHEEHHRVGGQTQAIKACEHIAKALVHAFHDPSIHGFHIIQAGVSILLIKAFVFSEWHVHRIVTEVQKKRLVIGSSPLNRRDGLKGKGFGEERVRAVIFFQPRHIPYAIALAPGGAVVLLPKVTPGASGGMSGNIDIEPDVLWVRPGCADRTEVSLADVDRMVPRVAQ